MSGYFVDPPMIKVSGTEISDEAAMSLAEVRVEQSIHVPDLFTMRFRDPGFALFDAGTFTIGDAVTIAFANGADFTQVAEGEITAISVEPGSTGRHDLVVSGLSKAHRLAKKVNVRTFQDITDSDVASQIAAAYGLSASTDSAPVTHDYLLQAASDFAFLSERAAAIGFQWWVSNGTLYFKQQPPESTGPPLTWEENLYSFRVRFSAAESAASSTVRGWNPDDQQSIVANDTVSGTEALGATATAATDADTAAKAFNGQRVALAARVMDQGEATAMANAARTRSMGDEIVAKGVAIGMPTLKAGAKVEVANMGSKLSGTYLLTAVEHVFDSGERYVTRFVAGGRYATSLVDLLGSQAPAEERSLRNAVLVGVVTSTDDPEDYGRVRVKFPALGDDDESAWARLAAPGGGNTRGLLLYPEVNDEVLVAFESGDLRRPVILGGLWSKQNQPPEKASTAVKDTEVVDRAWYSRLGHKIVMSDGTDQAGKSVAIDLSDGQTSFYLGEDAVKLDAPSDITVTGQKDITIQTGEGSVIVSAGQITLKASEKLVLQAPQIEITGSASVSVSGGKTDVKADGMMNVQAGGITSVKGSLVQLN